MLSGARARGAPMKVVHSVRILVALGLLLGCAQRGKEPRSPIGAATVTSAPLMPEDPIPAVLLEGIEEEAADPILETWGVSVPTEQELDEYRSLLREPLDAHPAP